MVKTTNENVPKWYERSARAVVWPILSSIDCLVGPYEKKGERRCAFSHRCPRRELFYFDSYQTSCFRL